ncbi:NAD(P)-dependent oxidoreductase [Streptomyces sp. Wb2n-11]|uniref:NAD(P)-dependent oxidoreductase n=1 Tax=Streptomyces sp. Wb2n-11 TaxID=1030533 RepID=UPI000AF624C0|nr:NAD(P)-dependent oxidoreductase [Streptomyces sp. Wb2n-11]
MKILAAGDHFVLNSLICDALEAAVTASPFELTELALPWPLEPFGRVAGVDEAGDCEEALIEALRDVEVCVTQMAPFTERVLEASPAPRLVAVRRGGPVNVNVEAARARGVRVCFAPGRNAAATAEFTVAMMPAAMRRLPQAHDSLARQGVWDGSYRTYKRCGFELEDTRVGLIGYDAVGSRVARVLSAFGAEVEVYDPYVRGDVHGVRAASLDALLSRSRVVTLHARLTDGTRGLIGAREPGLPAPVADPVAVGETRGPGLPPGTRIADGPYDLPACALGAGVSLLAGGGRGRPAARRSGGGRGRRVRGLRGRCRAGASPRVPNVRAPGSASGWWCSVLRGSAPTRPLPAP